MRDIAPKKVLVNLVESGHLIVINKLNLSAQVYTYPFPTHSIMDMS